MKLLLLAILYNSLYQGDSTQFSCKNFFHKTTENISKQCCSICTKLNDDVKVQTATFSIFFSVNLFHTSCTYLNLGFEQLQPLQMHRQLCITNLLTPSYQMFRKCSSQTLTHASRNTRQLLSCRDMHSRIANNRWKHWLIHAYTDSFNAVL